MTYNVSVIREECIGCAACVAVCDNFEMDDENISVVKKAKIEDDELESNQAGADACPKDCIKIEKEE